MKLNKSTLYLILIFFSFFADHNCNAQNTNNEQIKRLQRSIFIYNFSQQVKWPNQDAFKTFKIGVLGPDRTIIDLKSLAQKRKIQNKTVNVIKFNSVKEIANIQVLYVNNRFNFDVNYILNKINGKNILLITEDYEYNSSMINMVGVGNSFEYEINNQTLARENFSISPSLTQYAVTSSDKWKELYQDSQKTLQKTKEVVNKKEEELQEKEKEIVNHEETITSQNTEIYSAKENIRQKEKNIKELINQSEIQKRKYEDKVLLEKELEKSIKEQIVYIKAQNDSISKSNSLINNQKEFLKQQAKDIAKKQEILAEKDSTINAHKRANWLLFFIIGLILFGSISLYRNFLAKKKLNTILEEKNINIEKQSALLESKNKELEQFAYITSHDLKEPLTTISGLTRLLIEEYENKLDESGKMSLGYINESSVRMRQLIDDLLDYSRLGKSQEHKTINCNKLLKQITDDLANIINRTNATINISDLPNIKGSELEIRLLLQNLINNALKFTKPNITPIVNISAELITNDTEGGASWKFSVEDNGIGIEEKHKDKIFAIFQRLHSREKYEGTGIGLAHCKKIVESHDGKLWLDSIYGEGTTFYFSIPEKIK